jgi:iron complex transport system permease protein
VSPETLLPPAPVATGAAPARAGALRPRVRHRRWRPSTPTATALVVLGVLALVACAAFLLLDAQGAWAFVLTFRGTKLAAMVLVGYAIAVSTVLFQTITHNRILTPSVMGFDALYVLLQTLLVFGVGSARVATVDPRLRYLVEVALMVVLSGLLFRWLFGGARRSLHLLVLVGIVFGVLFRSVAGFLQRLIDPNAFAVLQGSMLASFNAVDPALLGVSAVLVAGASAVAWRMRHAFDVLALGRETAVSLGVDHQRAVRRVLVVVAVLVSVSTALVGPVTFFGLLVANLAHVLVRTHRHAAVLPAAVLLGVLCLVGGQTVLERALGLDSTLGVVVEFAGGLAFLVLLLRGVAR